MNDRSSTRHKNNRIPVFPALQLALTFSSLQRRFLSKVDSSGDCWLWTGYRDRDGYGCAHDPDRGGKSLRANRVAYELFIGPIPGTLRVLHHCDNPPCVNPRHLFLGTDADNHRDRGEKGRTAKGERNGNAKLTAASVQQLRAAHAEGLSYQCLAERYGVNRRNVRAIVTRKTWKHLPAPAGGA